MGWGACALPVEFYTSELPCVHPSTHTSQVTSSVPLEVNIHEESTSSVHSGLSLPWSTQNVTTPLYSTTPTASYVSDNQSFHPAVEASQISLTTSDLPQEDRRGGEAEEAGQVPTDSSNI